MVFVLFLFNFNIVYMSTIQARASDAEELTLYAQSAVLMDADSGRVLYVKNGQEARPMASTTKIMTCILALEYGRLDSTVSVSAEAAAQPQVHLGMQQGESFRLRDLLYSLMLESHNDSAVAVAEHIGGSVSGFAEMMNQKARELGCEDTHFITPNGLDQTDEGGVHHTTARDLALIMRYCVYGSPKSREFLEITQTKNYVVNKIHGKRTCSCANHNAFLSMMEGAVSGKTGFTGDAGYCYVAALERGERRFIVALLACGWPNNKGYKWKDTRALFTYGLEHYHYRKVSFSCELPTVNVVLGIPDNGYRGPSTASLTCDVGKKLSEKVLLRDDEQMQKAVILPKQITAPVKKDKIVGRVTYKIGDYTVADIPVRTTKTVGKWDFFWALNIVGQQFAQM